MKEGRFTGDGFRAEVGGSRLADVVPLKQTEGVLVQETKLGDKGEGAAGPAAEGTNVDSAKVIEAEFGKQDIKAETRKMIETALIQSGLPKGAVNLFKGGDVRALIGDRVDLDQGLALMVGKGVEEEVKKLFEGKLPSDGLSQGSQFNIVKSTDVLQRNNLGFTLSVSQEDGGELRVYFLNESALGGAAQAAA